MVANKVEQEVPQSRAAICCLEFAPVRKLRPTRILSCQAVASKVQILHRAVLMKKTWTCHWQIYCGVWHARQGIALNARTRSKIATSEGFMQQIVSERRLSWIQVLRAYCAGRCFRALDMPAGWCSPDSRMFKSCSARLLECGTQHIAQTSRVLLCVSVVAVYQTQNCRQKLY